MYLSSLLIKGYKVFGDNFTINLNAGINVIVGENGSGKTAILDALRLILYEDELSRNGITDSCFHRPVTKAAKEKGADLILISAQFENLTETEQVAYLPWLDLNNPTKAKLNVSIENKEDFQGKFKRKFWGNESVTGLFEWDLLDRIQCIYLPPLRDAEDKLRAYRGSRLARLMRSLRKNEEQKHSLEMKFSRFNRDLLKDESIVKANASIRNNVRESVGLVFGQETSIQFTEINFNRIVERLRLLFYPITDQEVDLNLYRELNENSLGFNNILYIATILAELEGLSETETFHKVLLIEEPEAHLHPQLQIKLFQYLQQKATSEGIQIIVTTHSPTLASVIDLNNIHVVSIAKKLTQPKWTSLSECGYDSRTKDFIERWLDVTKSSLLFSKGVLFVEGIAEALIISELAKIIFAEINKTEGRIVCYGNLDEYGISIINLNGIYFKQFFTLFKGYKKMASGSIDRTQFIPIRCAGLTDNDPDVKSKPTKETVKFGKNPQLYLINELKNHSPNCRLFSNLKTFEYDLALEANNLSIMADVQLSLLTTDGKNRKRLEMIKSKNWWNEPELAKADEAYWLLNVIDKGEFAQKLSLKIGRIKTFGVPGYIEQALKWLIGYDK